MNDNIISKIVRLIFDRESGKKTEEDAKKSLGGIDAGLDKLKESAKHLAEALAAAFAIHKLIEFGKEAIKQATASDRAWSSLRQTIQNAGGDIERLVPLARKASDAFAAATIHDDDSFAVSLQRLIVLTGDSEASLRNMGLVANVAAAFFEGDLVPATELVAKVMNGNTTVLHKMGIETKNAQDALDLLAKRSMGAATQEASTFGGQMKQLNNVWDDFQKAVGFALIGTNSATSTLGLLQGVIKSMITWVENNQSVIREWVTNGINFAITAADLLYRATVGLANIFQGAFNYALGVVASGLSWLGRGYANAIDAVAEFRKYFDPEGYAAMLRHAAAVRADAEAIEEWAVAAKSAGRVQMGKGVNILGTPVFTPPKAGVVSAPPLKVEAPIIATGNLDDLAKFDADYWKKRIGTTASGLSQITKMEKTHTTMLKAEFSARQEAAAALAGELFDVLSGGIGPAAFLKAKQNALESAELGVRAFIASLNPLSAWQVPELLSGAAEHAALATAWFGLSAAAGGIGGSAPNVHTSLGAGAAAKSAASAEDAKNPGVQVTVYVDGIDPKSASHQALLAQTNEEIKERYGENSQITVLSGALAE